MSSAEQKQVLNVAEVAAVFGRTEASIRHALARRALWLPPAFKMGSRWGWRRKDVDDHLRKLADGEIVPRRRGRPRKNSEEAESA